MITHENYDLENVGTDLLESEERPIGMIYTIGSQDFIHQSRMLGGLINRPTAHYSTKERNVLVINEHGVDLRLVSKELIQMKRVMNGTKKDSVTHVVVHEKSATQFINTFT